MRCWIWGLLAVEPGTRKRILQFGQSWNRDSFAVPSLAAKTGSQTAVSLHWVVEVRQHLARSSQNCSHRGNIISDNDHQHRVHHDAVGDQSWKAEEARKTGRPRRELGRLNLEDERSCLFLDFQGLGIGRV